VTGGFDFFVILCRMLMLMILRIPFYVVAFNSDESVDTSVPQWHNGKV